MWQRKRRVLISGSPHSWQFARQQYAALKSERDALRQELDEVRRERDELRHAINEMLATRRARDMAEAELVRFYRERDIERAKAAVRNPTTPLN